MTNNRFHISAFFVLTYKTLTHLSQETLTYLILFVVPKFIHIYYSQLILPQKVSLSYQPQSSDFLHNGLLPHSFLSAYLIMFQMNALSNVHCESLGLLFPM